MCGGAPAFGATQTVGVADIFEQSCPEMPRPRRRKQLDHSSLLRQAPGATLGVVTADDEVSVPDPKPMSPNGDAASGLTKTVVGERGVVAYQWSTQPVMFSVVQQEGARPVFTSRQLTVVRGSSGDADVCKIKARALSAKS